MADSKPDIVLGSTSDRPGGAEQMALSLRNGSIDDLLGRATPALIARHSHGLAAGNRRTRLEDKLPVTADASRFGKKRADEETDVI